jgi:hypothetical protein
LPDVSGNSRNATLSTGSSPDGGLAASGAGFAIGSGGKIGNVLTLARDGYGYCARLFLHHHLHHHLSGTGVDGLRLPVTVSP